MICKLQILTKKLALRRDSNSNSNININNVTIFSMFWLCLLKVSVKQARIQGWMVSFNKITDKSLGRHCAVGQSMERKPKEQKVKLNNA
jgi:hypothetical protein